MDDKSTQNGNCFVIQLQHVFGPPNTRTVLRNGFGQLKRNAESHFSMRIQ